MESYMVTGLAWEFLEGAVTTQRFMDAVSADGARAKLSGQIHGQPQSLYDLPLLTITYYHELEPTWFSLPTPILCCHQDGVTDLHVERPDDVRIVARVIGKDGSERRLSWPERECEVIHEGAD
jgi:hypothetical protein